MQKFYKVDNFAGYTPKFKGAIVRAEDRNQAAAMLNIELRARGLKPMFVFSDFTEIPKSQKVILYK